MYYLSIFYFFLLSLNSVKATELESYTYRLSQSNTQYQFWTTPPSERVFQDDSVPESSGNAIKVYAARNEFEPFQVIAKPAANGEITVSIGDFGSGIVAEIHQVKYVYIARTSDNLGRTGNYPDPLQPIANGASVSLVAGQNVAFWVTVSVPDGTPAGDYRTHLSFSGISIPVDLHVFNFSIPRELHVKSQMNFSHNTLLQKYGVSGTGENYWAYVKGIKQFFIDHRLTPKSVLWSGGVTSSGGRPYIDYDCAGTFTDNDGIWGFEQPAQIFLNGTGFNEGVGFPSFMAATFQNNDASQDQRPASFCGQNRSAIDWLGSNATPYNQLWFSYMHALQDYLNNLGYLDKAYYYFANEPQDQTDYDAVAWYSQELKRSAPNLKLMLSEEPRSEIFNHPQYPGAKIDIWLPVLNNYDPVVSHERAQNHGEESWIYFLHSTRPPYFNPITLDHPGIESKLTGWFLWKYRVRGIAYYALNNWQKNPWTEPMTDNHNGDWFMLYPPSEDNQPIAYGASGHRLTSSIRFELMRDSLEDYEYLYLLNGGVQAQVGQQNPADEQANKVISGLTSYTRDSEFMYNLRRLIGLKNAGEIALIPDISPASGHARAEGLPGNYYINFQDPNAEPVTTPLTVNGNNYTKIGWNEYDEQLGYGWFGDMAHVKYQNLSSAPNVLQGSVIYDDWGRQKLFEFDLPNGTYNVSVSAGWHDRRYGHNFIEIEGVDFINDEATDPYLLRSHQVTVSDRKLSMNMGIFNEYTMLNYLDIEAQTIAGLPTPPVLNLSINGLHVSASWNSVADATGYQLFYAPPDISYIGEIDMAEQTSLSVDLQRGATFYVAVKAYNAVGSSGYSNIGFFRLE